MSETCGKKLFNPFAEEEQKLFCGETTNILDLSTVKYPYFIEWVNKTYANNWLPEKVSNMAEDKYQYSNDLTADEKDAYDTELSFLIFLDSLQTNNLPNIAEYITLPEVVYALARQTYEEAIHSRSYGYILINAVGQESMHKIVYKYKEDETLLHRNEFIATIYEECSKERNAKNFLRDLIANYLLEGLYFYNGFNFFHNLAYRGLMMATNIQISYIRRDENSHLALFKKLIKIFKQELPNDFDTDLVYDMFKQAVEWEKRFSLNTLGNKITGISEKTITDYTHYIANKRLKDIGLEPIFPKAENPYKHLDKFASVDGDETTNRANQFEVTSITYKDPSILDGWDEI